MGGRGGFRGGRGLGPIRGGFRGRGQGPHPYGFRPGGEPRRDSVTEGNSRLAKDPLRDHQYKGKFPMPPPLPLDRYKMYPERVERRVSPPVPRDYYTASKDPFERPPPAYYRGARSSSTR